MLQRVVTLLDCRRPKETEIPKLWNLDTAFFFSDDCSGVNARKGQHGVGLPIKEEFIIKAGTDSIAIECISARLLMARIWIKSNVVTSW